MGRLKSLDEWLNYQQNLHSTEINLGLERVGNVGKILFPSGVPFKIISVSGTNGKGSTCGFIENIYQQSGVKIGKFSSPHILKYNERFRINCISVAEAKICAAFEQIESARGNISLTYFEFSALAALLIFAQAKVEIAVLEVGLGGRLDAVNMLDAAAAVITNIAIDHAEYLGNTREEIGFEKAGIMRKNRPCICADNSPPTSILQQAKSIGAKLEFVPQPYHGEIGLLGQHQRQNAAAAAQTVAALQAIFPVSQADIQAGIKNTKLLGRLQIKNFGDKTFILDLAHNPAAAAVLAAELGKNPQPTVAIFAVMKDKDIALMIEFMRSKVDKWILPQLENPRAKTAQNLSKLFTPEDTIEVCENMPKALTLSLNQPHFRILIFGSFDIIKEAIKAFERLN
ncbi:MAG: bifunctional folylpolyglutamate synthase/dihydrofolate synthase [Candidatus Thioglobus sp.]|nr:bifunctional folylpolyglutamate synthase/dihydrofolate synthase [Candidatus Thioglobus sp.]